MGEHSLIGLVGNASLGRGAAAVAVLLFEPKLKNVCVCVSRPRSVDDVGKGKGCYAQECRPLFKTVEEVLRGVRVQMSLFNATRIKKKPKPSSLP